MQLTLGVVAALAASVLANPMVTPAPRAEERAHCYKHVTTTSFVPHACLDICVEPDSPSCPKLFCPLIPVSCPPGSTFTTPPIPPTTSTISTVTTGCTVTVEEEISCPLCGCVGCPKCVAAE